jgi:NitT/TauT family transport system substrate-binding protein
MIAATARRLLTVLFVAAAVIQTAPAPAQTRLRLGLDGPVDGSAAILTHAIDQGFFKTEGLDVALEAQPSGVSLLQALAADRLDLAVIDVNAVLRFRDANAAADVKMVLMLQDAAPFAIVGRRSRGISAEPKSLEGKKLGAPATDPAAALWPLFRTLAKIDDKAIKLEPVGPAVREPMLATGEIDAVFGSIYTTPLNLRARGIPEADIVVLPMSKHGLLPYGLGLVASPKLMKEKPEAVRGAVAAIVAAARETAANPQRAIASVLSRADGATRDLEIQRLKLMLDTTVLTAAVRENGFGAIDPRRWVEALEQLHQALPFKDKARAGAAFTGEFLPEPDRRKLD